MNTGLIYLGDKVVIKFISTIILTAFFINTCCYGQSLPGAEKYNLAPPSISQDLSGTSPLLENPEHFYASHITGVSKPDSRSYMQVVNDAGLSPEESLLIDDNENNVRGALNASLHALQFDTERPGKSIKDIIAFLSRGRIIREKTASLPVSLDGLQIDAGRLSNNEGDIFTVKVVVNIDTGYIMPITMGRPLEDEERVCCYDRFTNIQKEVIQIMKKMGYQIREVDTGERNETYKNPVINYYVTNLEDLEIFDQVPPASESLIKCVIFDLGNVISRYDYRKAARALAIQFGVDENLAFEFFEERNTNPDNPFYKYEKGLIGEDKLLEEVNQWIDLHKKIPRAPKLDKGEFERIYNSVWMPDRFTPIEDIPATIALMRVLRSKGYQLRALTNTNDIHYRHFMKYSQAAPPESDGILEQRISPIRRKILAALARTQVIYAESEEAINLLKANNTSCLLLSSGKYLVTKGVTQDGIKLLRAIAHEDIEALMQISSKEDRYKYQGIKELILEYFPPEETNTLPIDLYVNHTVARAFEWLLLLEDGALLRNEIPQMELNFINSIEPIINAYRHNYFTGEFWNSKIRGERIRDARNKGMRFYQVASAKEEKTTASDVYINPDIFRSNDIRGIADKDLPNEVAVRIGQAYGTFLRQKLNKKDITITVGRDVRVSSPRLQEAIIKGIRETGVNVIDIGMVPTPVLYFSVPHYGVDGGVMVTASHLPPEFNGLKLMAGTLTTTSEELQEISDIARKGEFVEGSGKYETRDIVPTYIEMVKSKIGKSLKGLKIVVDTGNGTVGYIISKILKDLGAEVYGLYLEPDGTFPNHLADPDIDENLKDLISKVQEVGADIGLAFDCDGDRVRAINDKGEIVLNDQFLALLAREVLKAHPRTQVVTDSKTSDATIEYIERFGGIPVRWKTGHTKIKAKMHELGERCQFGGDPTGHFMYTENYYYDDAIYAGVKLLNLLITEKQNLSRLTEEIPLYPITPDIRMSVTPQAKKRVPGEILEHFRGRGYEVSDLDGARIIFPEHNGWALVRASGTEDKLTCRAEAKTYEELDKILDVVYERLSKCSDIDLSEWPKGGNPGIHINPNIFRSNDIRGIADKDLPNEVAVRIGQAYGTFLRQKLNKKDITITVGRDVRISSPRLQEAIIKGIRETGVNVVDIGMVPTPVLYFSIPHYKVDGGIVVTASHLPPEFNGFKFMIGTSSTIAQELQEILGIAQKGEFVEGNGKYETRDVVPTYIEMVKSKIGKSLKGRKIVIDAGNGTTGYIVSKILKDLGAEVYGLYLEPDGTFPNHLADPDRDENIRDLVSKVQEVDADIGIAFDCDGDRTKTVTGKGKIVLVDKLIALLAREVLKTYPHSQVVISSTVSEATAEYVERLGGRAIRWKVGHSNIKSKMHELGKDCRLGGELSGHIMYAENYYYDDAIYAIAKLLNLLITEKESFDELIGEIPSYPITPDIRMKAKRETKDRAPGELYKFFRSKGYEVSDLDGARVIFPEHNGWAAVRASGTEDKITFRTEARTDKGLKKVLDVMYERLNKYPDIDLSEWPRASTSSKKDTEGLLFQPKYNFEMRKPITATSIRTTRSAEEVLEILKKARDEGIELSITGALRLLDGPGSSLDIPEFVMKLTEQGAVDLNQIPSTPTIASDFTVKIKFELADDEDVIEYVAPDYGITEDNPYRIRGELELTTQGRTPHGQRDAPAFIFRNIFGLRGIKITCGQMNPMALAGGMESSGVFSTALIAVASILSGANLSYADIASLELKLDNDEFGGVNGAQGSLCSILGGAYRHVWLFGVKDERGTLKNPLATVFSIPLLSEEAFSNIEEHMLLVQAGKVYKKGKSEGRTSALINIMWTDLLRDEDEIGLPLHQEKLGLASRYTRALREGDFETVVETINRYVDIRDELCRRWISLALDAHEGKEGPEYAKKYANKIFNPSNPDFNVFGVVREMHEERKEELHSISLYTLEPIASLIKTARSHGISIMPLGAGGPGSNLIAISPKGVAHLRSFLESQGLKELTEAKVRKIISGTGILKGYMPCRIGKEPLAFTGFEELGLELPQSSTLVTYDTIGPVSDSDTAKRGQPLFAFENMPEGRFNLKQYRGKTGVPISTARRDFNILEELGLVTIHRGSGGKPNEIESIVPEELKPQIIDVLNSYRTKRDLPRIKAEILKIKSKVIYFMPPDAYGEAILATTVLKAIHERFPDSIIKVILNPKREPLLEGYLKKNDPLGGFIDAFINPEDSSCPTEGIIDVSWHQDLLPNIALLHYTETMLRTAENQFKKKLGIDVKLNRNHQCELRFNGHNFEKDIRKGKELVGNLLKRCKEEGKQGIIWLGTSATSRNRMHPYGRDFWQAIVESLKDRFIFYEIRGLDTEPVCESVEPARGEEVVEFAALAEIMKATVAGIGIDSMHMHFANAIGRKNMVLILGPTHPAAIVYPEAEDKMLTIPPTHELSGCYACGNHGYINAERFSEIREAMSKRLDRKFEFDEETHRAVEIGTAEAMKGLCVRCRQLLTDERLYDCWDGVNADKVIEKMKRFFVAIGVDLGGTKIASAAVRSSGQLMEGTYSEIPTEADTDRDRIINNITRQIQNAIDKSKVDLSQISGIAISSPGPLNPITGVVESSVNLKGFINVDLKRIIEKRLEEIYKRKFRVFIQHDAAAAALGEELLGAGKGFEDFHFMTVSTGIGSGIIRGRKIYYGKYGNQFDIGETGMMEGLDQARPNLNLMDLASGLAIAKMAKEAVKGNRNTRLLEFAPNGKIENITTETVAQAALQRDKVALEIINKAAEYIGLRLVGLIDEYNEKNFVLGGGVTKIGSIFIDKIKETIKREKPDFDTDGIGVAILGTKAGILGAAASIPDFLDTETERIGVTGGTGSIGSPLIGWLLRYRDTYIDVLTRRELPARERRKVSTHDARVNLRQGSLFDIPALEEFVINNDVIFHLAGWSKSGATVSPEEALLVNCLSTAFLARLAKKHNKRIVFPSSVVVYRLSQNRVGVLNEDSLVLSDEVEHFVAKAVKRFGQYAKHALSQGAVDREEMEQFVSEFLQENPLPDNMDLYGLTKIIGERLVLESDNSLCLRLADVYGPQDETGRALPSIFKAAIRQDGQLQVKDDTKQFIYMDDVLRVLEASISVQLSQDKRVINVPGPESINTLEAAETIKDLTGAQTNITPVAAPVPTRMMEGGRLASALQIQPAVPFNKGIEMTHKWWRERAPFSSDETKEEDFVYIFDYDNTLSAASTPLDHIVKEMPRILTLLIAGKKRRVCIVTAKSFYDSIRINGKTVKGRRLISEIDDAIKRELGKSYYRQGVEEYLEQLEFYLDKGATRYIYRDGELVADEDYCIAIKDDEIEIIKRILSEELGIPPERIVESAISTAHWGHTSFAQIHRNEFGIGKVLIRPYGWDESEYSFETAPDNPQVNPEGRKTKVELAEQIALRLRKEGLRGYYTESGGKVGIDITAARKDRVIRHLYERGFRRMEYYGDDPQGSDKAIFEMTEEVSQKSEFQGLDLKTIIVKGPNDTYRRLSSSLKEVLEKFEDIKGRPLFAFENMPEGRFNLKQYRGKTGVPISTARRDFNILEELGLVTIHRGSGGKPNEIESIVPEHFHQSTIKLLKSYRNRNDIPRLAIEILQLKDLFELILYLKTADLKRVVFAFDIDNTVNPARNTPIDKGVAEIFYLLLKAGIKIAIIAGKSKEEFTEYRVLEPLYEICGKETQLLENMVIYTSEGAGKFRVTPDLNLEIDKTYSKSFSRKETQAIQEEIAAMAAELNKTYDLSNQGVTPFVRNFSNLKYNFSPYGNKDKSQYAFEKDETIAAGYSPRRLTRREIGEIITKRLRARGVKRIRYEISGSTTIGFIRHEVSKTEAIKDILNGPYNLLVYTGNEVLDGNDRVVGEYAEKEERLIVASVDRTERKEVRSRRIYWIGEELEGTVRFLHSLVDDIITPLSTTFSFDIDRETELYVFDYEETLGKTKSAIPTDILQELIVRLKSGRKIAIITGVNVAFLHKYVGRYIPEKIRKRYHKQIFFIGELGTQIGRYDKEGKIYIDDKNSKPLSFDIKKKIAFLVYQALDEKGLPGTTGIKTRIRQADDPAEYPKGESIEIGLEKYGTAVVRFWDESLRKHMADVIERLIKPLGEMGFKVAASTTAIDISPMDKGEALKRLLQIIEREEGKVIGLNHVIVGGDSQNDYAMLSLKGVRAFYVGTKDRSELPEEVAENVYIPKAKGPAGAMELFKLGRLQELKRNGEKITMLTAYDTETARALSEAGLEMLLVGDSVAQVKYGYPTTNLATMDMMLKHVRLVAEGVKGSNTIVIGDMPYRSYDTPEEALANARRLIEAGADAVKLEGGKERKEVVQTLVNAGIPVMGHIGYTPQFGRARVFGGTKMEMIKLLEDALSLEEAGAFSIVMEMVYSGTAQMVSRNLQIPTIGIGSGVETDGQVLVIDDILGLTRYRRLGDKKTAHLRKKPRFVERFKNGEEFVAAVKSGKYPMPWHYYQLERRDVDLHEFEKELRGFLPENPTREDLFNAVSKVRRNDAIYTAIKCYPVLPIEPHSRKIILPTTEFTLSEAIDVAPSLVLGNWVLGAFGSRYMLSVKLREETLEITDNKDVVRVPLKELKAAFAGKGVHTEINPIARYKGLAVDEIFFAKGATLRDSTSGSYHLLYLAKGKAKIFSRDERELLGELNPDNPFVIVTAQTGEYKLVAEENTQIIKSFVSLGSDEDIYTLREDVDAEYAKVLLFDLLHAPINEGKTYEIKYDTSRLSPSQIEIIETYIGLLKKRASNPNNIKPRPFSNKRGSKESLIAVYCTGKDFKGEGHVDIKIPEGGIQNYLLKITGMVNIALAASSIPDDVTREDLDTKYGPIIGFIKNQYKAILGTELIIPDSMEQLLRTIRHIVLSLPRAYRMPINKIEEYNRLAKKALVFA